MEYYWFMNDTINGSLKCLTDGTLIVLLMVCIAEY